MKIEFLDQETVSGSIILFKQVTLSLVRFLFWLLKMCWSRSAFENKKQNSFLQVMPQYMLIDFRKLSIYGKQ